MKRLRNEDWFNKIVLGLVVLKIESIKLRKSIVRVTYENLYNAEHDFNLCEKLSHIVDLQNQSLLDIEELVQELLLLEKTGVSFPIADLKEEFTYIQENIDLEFKYFNTIREYLSIIYDFNVQGDDITIKCEENMLDSTFLYNQMKVNNQNLKQLKKERRNDYFE